VHNSETQLEKRLAIENAQTKLVEQHWAKISSKNALEQMRRNKALAMAKTNQAEVYGHVTAYGTNWRLVLAWSGTETIVVEDLSASSDVDCIAYHIGYCIKPSSNPLFESFRYERWTTDLNKAAEFYLKLIPTNSPTPLAP
jgi:hypothetical protein